MILPRMKCLNFTAASLLLLLVACTTVYVPAPGTPNLREIADFQPGLRVKLANGQPKTENTVLSSHNNVIYYANLHDWTDRLNQSIRETFKKKHVEVAEAATKSLTLSIGKAVIDMKAGGLNPRCTLDWTVLLGDGTTLSMTLETGHWKVEDASNVAVRLACRDTLRDERVRQYLSAP